MKFDIQVNRTRQSRLPEVDFEQIPFGKVFSDHQFVAEYRDGAWHDARIEPFGTFQMHPASMVLHYGQSIFEGMKASKSHEGTPLFFRPEEHARRLNRSAARMCIPEVPEDLFLDALHQLVALDQGWIPPREGSALYIRPFVFATDRFIGVRPSSTYRFMVITGPVGPYYDHPVSLWAEQKYVRAVTGGTGEAKCSGNYAASLLPAKLAQERGYDQVMWMDGHEFKYIEEVGTMNIFFVIDGKVITPSLDGSILAGITRDSMLTILRDEGIEVEERRISIEEVFAAHDAGTLLEVFGTGTAAVVAQVSRIGHPDREIDLPPVEGRKIGPMVKAQIDGLRSGKVKDERGWIVPVGTDVPVDA